jgi:hypothetical protein
MTNNKDGVSHFKAGYFISGCMMLLLLAGLSIVPHLYGQDGLWEFLTNGVKVAEETIPVIGAVLLPMMLFLLLGFPVWVISLAWDKNADEKVDKLGEDMGLYSKIEKKDDKDK